MILSCLWYKKDNIFWISKVGAFFLIKSPLAHSIPLNSVKTRLYIDFVVDAFTEYAYNAR
ncbi:hypothetical protein C2G38_2189516 [Gigaspora rosea]|uniref:Peptidase M16 middle/third domain-containing protein n=1 Tax=Gigaspora rosea TaxID=44941 RepID=A0A397V3K6_9GLOM|nr:hypothetical protein C2G38_2189516 [Gigaspora rosea]